MKLPGIMLPCTKIRMLACERNASSLVFPASALHARAAVERMLR